MIVRMRRGAAGADGLSQYSFINIRGENTFIKDYVLTSPEDGAAAEAAQEPVVNN